MAILIGSIGMVQVANAESPCDQCFKKCQRSTGAQWGGTPGLKACYTDCRNRYAAEWCPPQDPLPGEW